MKDKEYREAPRHAAKGRHAMPPEEPVKTSKKHSAKPEHRDTPRHTAEKQHAAKRSKPANVRPKKRRRKKSHFLRNFLSLVLIILLAGVFMYLLDMKGYLSTGFSGYVNGLVDNITGKPVSPSSTAKTTVSGNFSDLFENEDKTDGLDVAEGNSISVTDLSVTEGLSEDWLNVLLLGADARNTTEPCRTDTMIICSINKNTGSVKLTSIMRDTCVALPGHPSTRINSAYFYGKEQLAMRAVNYYFGMNIEKYVFVDFSSFASIAEALGGIDVNITKNEMTNINKNVAEQYHVLINQGKMEYDEAEQTYYATELKEYGENIHLNGMQTLGYARVRKIDSDFARAERQRRVLNLMLAKLKGASLNQIMSLVYGNISYIRTNLELNDIVNIAQVVLSNTSSMSADELRLPVNGTYKEEVRNNEAMLYDTDFKQNTLELYAFIYN